MTLEWNGNAEEKNLEKVQSAVIHCVQLFAKARQVY